MSLYFLLLIGLCEYFLEISVIQSNKPVQCYSDRIRTTNNMLGDCYAAAIVEHLSRKELMACDAVAIYQDLSSVSNGHISANHKDLTPELVVETLDNKLNKTDKQKQ